MQISQILLICMQYSETCNNDLDARNKITHPSYKQWLAYTTRGKNRKIATAGMAKPWSLDLPFLGFDLWFVPSNKHLFLRNK